MTHNPILTPERHPLAACIKLKDNPAMTDLSFSLPDDLAGPLKLRLAEGQYADAAWVREMIAEGETSGYLDADPSAIIEEIIAERHARRG